MFIRVPQFGGPEVLTISDVEIPQPGPEQIRVRVRAASVNPLDVDIRNGDLAVVFPVQFPVTPGLDVAAPSTRPAAALPASRPKTTWSESRNEPKYEEHVTAQAMVGQYNVLRER